VRAVGTQNAQIWTAQCIDRNPADGRAGGYGSSTHPEADTERDSPKPCLGSYENSGGDAVELSGAADEAPLTRRRYSFVPCYVGAVFRAVDLGRGLA